MKTQLREDLKMVMTRPSNPNNTPEKLASVLGAVCGVQKSKIEKFINGDDDAITDSEAAQISSTR